MVGCCTVPDAADLDPGLVIEVRSWLHLAALDLDAATRLAEDPEFAPIVVYHCQQAAEKTIKGLLTFHGIRFGRTHDLDVLGSLALPRAPTLAPVLDRAVDLTPYAWMYRYPPDTPSPLAAEARGTIDTARALLDATLETLPADVRPP
jgi:HEPN domain-containing protein